MKYDGAVVFEVLRDLTMLYSWWWVARSIFLSKLLYFPPKPAMANIRILE